MSFGMYLWRYTKQRVVIQGFIRPFSQDLPRVISLKRGSTPKDGSLGKGSH